MQDEFKELVKRAKKGDAYAFSQLYMSVYKDLYKYAYYTLRTREDAEDAVSDTVIDCYATIGRLRDESAFKKWMFTILSAKCKRKIAQYYNQCNNNYNQLQENEAVHIMDFDKNIDLKNAFSALNDDDRQIISLTLFGGYDSKEVSDILKMNRNTVRSRYSRALEKLRNELSPDYQQQYERNEMYAE